MAVVPVTFNGVMYPKGKAAGDKPVPCVFIGSAWITGLRPDIDPPVPPVDPPTEPPTEPPVSTPIKDLLTVVLKEPPAGGGWGWFPEYGWLYAPSGAGPKK